MNKYYVISLHPFFRGQRILKVNPWLPLRHIAPLCIHFVCMLCFLVKIRISASLIHFHFILGPKLGSGLPNTCLFSWTFSVKFFVEYLRPHLRTQGQFPNNVFCGVLILPFPLGNVVINISLFCCILPITYH